MGKCKRIAVFAMLVCFAVACWHDYASSASPAHFIAGRSDTKARASGAGSFTYSIRGDSACGGTICFADDTLVGDYTMSLAGDATYFNTALHGSPDFMGGGAETSTSGAWGYFPSKAWAGDKGYFDVYIHGGSVGGGTISLACGAVAGTDAMPLAGGLVCFNTVLHGNLEAGGGGAESRTLGAWAHVNTNAYIVASGSPGRLNTNAVVIVGRGIQATARAGDGRGHSDLTARVYGAGRFNNLVQDNSVGGGGNCTDSIASVALTDTKGVNVFTQRDVHKTTRTSDGCGNFGTSIRSAVRQPLTVALCFNSRQAPLTTVT